MRKMRVAILFGGVSPEHDVSLLSARSVIEHLPQEKYEIVMLGIKKTGEWLLYRGGTDKLPGGKWEDDPDNLPAFISPDASVHGVIVRKGHECETIRLDAAFPVMHGSNGEDGTVQGLLTMAQIPFVGCGTAASAVCMDKALTKAVLGYYGVAQAKWDSAGVAEFEKNGAAIIDRVEKKLGYPVYVKPANAGSSVGITRAEDRNALYRAVDEAAKYDTKIVFEETVSGREIECAVLGGTEPVASCCGEIITGSGFYDYDTKYLTDEAKLVIPAQLPDGVQDKVRATALHVFGLLGCSGLARMDFFVRASDGAVLFNEPNTIPGFTAISMYPKLFEASGIPYGELLDTLIKLSIPTKFGLKK